MSDKQLKEILEALAIIAMEGKGDFIYARAQSASWYSNHSKDTLIQLLPLSFTDDSSTMIRSFNVWMLFIRQDPIAEDFNHSNKIIFEMYVLMEKFFNRLHNFLTDDKLSLLTIGRENKEPMFKKYSQSLTGYEARFTVTMRMGCDETLLDNNIAFLLQESLEYILQEQTGVPVDNGILLE